MCLPSLDIRQTMTPEQRKEAALKAGAPANNWLTEPDTVMAKVKADMDKIEAASAAKLLPPDAADAALKKAGILGGRQLGRRTLATSFLSGPAAPKSLLGG